MAVTATANSEQLAVASLITYDVYRTYINPKVRIYNLCYTTLLHVI
jgi:Na+/proline symporter